VSAGGSKNGVLAGGGGEVLVGGGEDGVPAGGGGDSVPAGGERGEIENLEYKLWVKSDKLVRRWIMATIAEDLIQPMMQLRTAKEMWTFLELTLGKSVEVQAHGIGEHT
ncbi:hypothetical protein U1Q18_013530, partial [Sarracenia purpurea var. burkii]